MIAKPDQSNQPDATILIIEDTPPNLHLLATILARYGYQTISASDGPTGLSLAHTGHPDLILLDVRMPGMNGYEVCQQLKDDPITSHIPVIFVSAPDEPEDKVLGFSVGGIDYFTKPYQAQEIHARVKIHLALRNLQSQLELQNTQLQLDFAHFQRS
jgi:DNA-binding response OmpR family regulator